MYGSRSLLALKMQIGYESHGHEHISAFHARACLMKGISSLSGYSGVGQTHVGVRLLHLCSTTLQLLLYNAFMVYALMKCLDV